MANSKNVTNKTENSILLKQKWNFLYKTKIKYMYVSGNAEKIRVGRFGKYFFWSFYIEMV